MINLLNQYFQNTNLTINHTFHHQHMSNIFDSKNHLITCKEAHGQGGDFCPNSFSIRLNFKSTFLIVSSHPMIIKTKNTMTSKGKQDSTKPHIWGKIHPIYFSQN